MVRTTGDETLQILTKDNGTTGINYQSKQSFLEILMLGIILF